jgi:D-threonate/D-erythronate kinase
MLDCVVVADDLTGACDAAVHFAARGRRTTVRLRLPCGKPAADVLAFSTETRDAAHDRIGPRTDAVASAVLPLAPRILFRKIDSVLRGCPGREIAATLGAFRCDAAVITPAFPAMGRTVRRGQLYIDERPTLDVGARLRDTGLPSCTSVPPAGTAEVLAAGHQFVSLDACTEADLDMITVEGLHSTRRLLWAGSAGLASALARTLFATLLSHADPSPGKPVVFCLGSTHEATLAQESELLSNRPSVFESAERAAPERFVTALRGGKHVIIRITRGLTELELLRALLTPLAGECGALLACGGDTATLVCRAVGAQAITLRDEIITGVPCGILSGGICAGVPIVTKSGGFAASDALIRVADWFACPPS